LYGQTQGIFCVWLPWLGGPRPNPSVPSPPPPGGVPGAAGASPLLQLAATLAVAEAASFITLLSAAALVVAQQAVLHAAQPQPPPPAVLPLSTPAGAPAMSPPPPPVPVWTRLAAPPPAFDSRDVVTNESVVDVQALSGPTRPADIAAPPPPPPPLLSPQSPAFAAAPPVLSPPDIPSLFNSSPPVRSSLCLAPAVRLRLVTHLSPCQAAPPQPSLTVLQQLMALLSTPAGAQSLVGPALSSNALLSEDVRLLLGTPSMQAVLEGAASSTAPAQFFADALAAAGVDVAAVLGDARDAAAWSLAHPPPPPPWTQRSSAAGARSGMRLAVCAALAALLLGGALG
jgi:hypothetical protein